MPGWLWAAAGAALGSCLTLAAVLAWTPDDSGPTTDTLARAIIAALR